MIEACDAPRVLVRVDVSKEKAIGEEILPRPVFIRHDGLKGGRGRGQVRNTRQSIAICHHHDRHPNYV